MKFRIKLLSNLRQRFRKEYLGELIQKQNDNRVREPRVGEMVLIGDDNKKRLSWPIAKIIELIPGRDGDNTEQKSSVKNFSIGEQVVLLIPDFSNKIYARWSGPGEIIQHHPPHSYQVKLPDGTVRHIHVNKTRKYHPRALAVGVIFEDDQEFGKIHPIPNLSRSASERVLHETDLNHLKETEREKVLAILLKHHTLLTSDVKIAKVGAHRIRLRSNIERKKPFLYRIPESLKMKVDEQIEEPLRLDLIEESDAEIVYPIICVNKKDGVKSKYSQKSRCMSNTYFDHCMRRPGLATLGLGFPSIFPFSGIFAKSRELDIHSQESREL
ncbi:transposon Ty3-I Gag-Pol polyprotein [Trichonephila clavata]|uniref:Transposon Ty3-I Gag-Pol polyprotein n=1 Tax=Trichonephila clavata TaxID=2740835 RepID=A0A8X6H9Q4_TRICU|nr:transposon Ty3-I Gag-Pol polyprotein [Trichonephila clavata]